MHKIQGAFNFNVTASLFRRSHESGMEWKEVIFDSLSVLDGTIARADTGFVFMNWFSTVWDGAYGLRGRYICFSCLYRRLCGRGRPQRSRGGWLFFRVRWVGTQVSLLLADFIRCRITRRIIRRVTVCH